MPHTPPRPLDGATVVWTGSLQSGKNLISALEKAGADVPVYPLIEARPLMDEAQIAGVLSKKERFDWLVFSSAKAGALFPGPSKSVQGRIAAVGPATAFVLRQKGWPEVMVPDPHDAAALAVMVQLMGPPNARVLFVKGDKSLATVPDLLSAAGLHVDTLTVYETVAAPKPDVQEAVRIVEAAGDGLVIGSPSGVEVLAATLAPRELRELKPGLVWFTLGRTTARKLEARGVTDPIYPPNLSSEAFLSICVSALRGHR